MIKFKKLLHILLSFKGTLCMRMSNCTLEALKNIKILKSMDKVGLNTIKPVLQIFT